MLGRLTRTSTIISQVSRIQSRSASSVSDAALQGLESRWTRLPECEQAAVAEKLAELQRGDWKQMTPEQKRAAYYIAYGSFGARAPHDKTLSFKVYSALALSMAACTGIWYYWLVTHKKPDTLSPAGQAELEAIIEESGANPFTRNRPIPK